MKKIFALFLFVVPAVCFSNDAVKLPVYINVPPPNSKSKPMPIMKEVKAGQFLVVEEAISSRAGKFDAVEKIIYVENVKGGDISYIVFNSGPTPPRLSQKPKSSTGKLANFDGSSFGKEGNFRVRRTSSADTKLPGSAIQVSDTVRTNVPGKCDLYRVYAHFEKGETLLLDSDNAFSKRTAVTGFERFRAPKDGKCGPVDTICHKEPEVIEYIMKDGEPVRSECPLKVQPGQPANQKGNAVS